MATRRELLGTISARYAGESRSGKSRILDEFVAVTGYHRKHALRLLNQVETAQDKPERVGRRIYDEAVRAALIIVWETADRICGKRLKAALPSFVESMEHFGHLSLDAEVRRRLLTASASTIDRLLKPVRQEAGRRRRRGGASSSIRKLIPVRTFGDWNDPSPGYFEGDLVAHCGGSMAGSFVHSFVLTDIASGWTDALPLLVREQGLVTEALDIFRTTLPMPLLGLDTDNDSVFMNEILVDYCARHGVALTRSRPYRKNDQAWVEQKNGSVVRRLIGYDRLAGVAAAQILARLFENARLYVNFFQPSFKLRDKARDGAKVTRRYFPPATPCDRLLARPDVPAETKEKLRKTMADLDPVQLIKNLRDAQAELARLTSGGNEESTPDPNLADFLAQLPELWRKGENRATHRKRPPRVRTWRTRADPFEAVWSDAKKWLEQEPDITGKALFGRLRCKYPGEFGPGQLRTLQRRVREWRQAMARQLIVISTSATRRDSLSPHFWQASLAEEEKPEPPAGKRSKSSSHPNPTTEIEHRKIKGEETPALGIGGGVDRRSSTEKGSPMEIPPTTTIG